MANMEWYEAFIKLIGKEELIFQIMKQTVGKKGIFSRWRMLLQLLKWQ